MKKTKRQRAIAMGDGQHAARGMRGTVGDAIRAQRELRPAHLHRAPVHAEPPPELRAGEIVVHVRGQWSGLARVLELRGDLVDVEHPSGVITAARSGVLVATDGVGRLRAALEPHLDARLAELLARRIAREASEWARLSDRRSDAHLLEALTRGATVAASARGWPAPRWSERELAACALAVTRVLASVRELGEREPSPFDHGDACGCAWCRSAVDAPIDRADMGEEPWA